MLFSARARSNGPAFLLGWLVGLSAVVAIVYLVSDGADVATDDSASTGVGWGKVIIGVLLLAMAVRQWRSRPQPGEEPTLPKWMGTIDGFTPGKALATGVLLSGVNPKNLMLSAAAAATVAQAGLSTGDATVVLAVFVVLGTLTIVGPVAYSLLGGQSARATLDG
jgi:threonine/homoserine/homoserine lactone efflux protein